MWQIQNATATFFASKTVRGAQAFLSVNGREENPDHRREAHIWEQNRPV
jgi:hypothetical protein